MDKPDARNLDQRSTAYMAKLSTLADGDAEVRSIIEDLHLYQAELEQQNRELVQIQDDLEESRRKFYHLFDLAPVGFLNLNTEGIIIDINLCVCELLGLVRSYVQSGKTPLVGLLAGESHAEFFGLLRRVGGASAAVSANLRPANHSRNPRILQAHAVIRSDEASSEHGLICLLDITARCRAEEELVRKSRDLEAQNSELARFNKLVVGRELRMLELNREVNELCSKCGQPTRYAPEGPT